MSHRIREAMRNGNLYSNRIAKGVDDSARADKLLKGVVGKRLTYETTHSQNGSGKDIEKARGGELASNKFLR